MTDRVALLLRRAVFGPTATELAAARQAGFDATLAGILRPKASDAGAAITPVPTLDMDPFANLVNPTSAQFTRAYARRAAETDQITQWWLDRMVVADHQAYEKLVFFWHGHWATSIKKVGSAQLMLDQHRTLRQYAGNAASLAAKMVIDPALVLWLDGHLNTKSAPNENLGRELMELFLLGIGHYTEKDVKEAGRALTGWKVDVSSEIPVFQPKDHDGGKKTILGVTRRFDAASLVRHLLSQDTCPRFIASRLWYRYGSATDALPPATRDAMVAAFPDTLGMLQQMFASDAFAATEGQVAKPPVEWLVGAMRQLRIRPVQFQGGSLTALLIGLTGLGQLPFAPPSVGGWAAGSAWLTSAAAQVRIGLAARLADLLPPRRLDPEELAFLLAVPGWTDRTYAVLKEAGDPRRLLILGLVSPEYLVS